MTLVGGRKKGKVSAWITFVKKVQHDEGISFKEAMTRAAALKKQGKMKGSSTKGGDGDGDGDMDDSSSSSSSSSSPDVADLDDSMQGGKKSKRRSKKGSRKSKKTRKTKKRKSKKRKSRK